jgi:hypothetical protein
VRSNGKEIFYLTSDGKFMTASVETGRNSLSAVGRSQLFQTRLRSSVRTFDVSADGERFLVDQPIDPTITVIVNWPQLLMK